MPDPSRRAEARASRVHPARRSALLRAVVAVLALSALATPGLAEPQPAAADASCTGWTSLTSPPRTIRVLRTRTGKIETIGFRSYVDRVMASGEWPDHLRTATLEAGAVATKQYAWYHAMKGHHRAFYTRNGKCYDVRDDTADQLYKHYATPTARQRNAVSKTWGLTLRKSGRFFLTGYRAGVSGTCAADANGWKLYARSVEACAEQGWTYRRILNEYLRPNLSLVWSKQVGPVVSKPRLALKVGNSVASGAVTVSWQPLPRKATVTRFKLQRKTMGGGWRDVALPKAKVWRTAAWIKVDARTRFRVRARDGRGNWGPWSYGPRRHADVRGPAGTTIAGAERTANGARLAEGAGPAAAGQRMRKVKSRFVGRSVAVLMRTGPGMGRARVFIDGKRVATVDLDRPSVTRRKLVFARNWKKVGRHTIAVRAVPSTKRVEFSGFFVLR